jgi:tetratricopeptide (TPR) repeat protein
MVAAAIAAAALLGGFISLVLSMTSDTAKAPVATVSTPANRSPQAPVFEKPSEAAVRAQFESLESRRAGGVAYDSGDLTTALQKFQAAVDANPNDAEARNNLGQLLVRQNRAADALPHFDEAVRIDPQKWAYRFNRARVYGALNRWPEAVTEYRAAAQIFPGDYATYYNLGLALMKTKQYSDAVAALEQAVTLAPGEPTFLITLGTAYVAVEKPDRAKAAFQQFLELAPDHAEAPRVKAAISALDAAAAK